MKLSSKGRYATMAMVDLAAQSPARAVSMAEISSRQGISLAYLEQLFNKLRRAGLVAATRGPGGGYKLAAPADAIRLSDVLFAVDEQVRTNACSEKGEGCCGMGQCSCHDLWNALGAHILSFLGEVSLADVAAGKSHEFVAPGLGCKLICEDEANVGKNGIPLVELRELSVEAQLSGDQLSGGQSSGGQLSGEQV